jgi:hypothetical protein
MNKSDAIELLKLGKKISHPFFFEDWEWIRSVNPLVCDVYVNESGGKYTSDRFWGDRDHPSWEEGWIEFGMGSNDEYFNYI